MADKTGYEDKTLSCPGCNADFIWTAGEQEYYFLRNLVQPKYCPVCREERKKQNRGKIWGARVAQFDAETRQVLCGRCSSPASKENSKRQGRAVCPRCIGMKFDTSVLDILTIEDWAQPMGNARI